MAYIAGNPLLSVSRFVWEGAATNGQNAITIPGGCTPGMSDVFVGGACLSKGDFDDSDGMQVKLTKPMAAGTQYRVVVYAPNQTVQQVPGQLAGFRNKLINGSFDMWARGNNQSFGPFTYTADRWLGAVANGTLTAYIGGGPSSLTPNALAVNGAAGNTYAWLAQYIESFNTRALLGGFTWSGMLYAKNPQSFLLNIQNPTATDNWTSQATSHSAPTVSHPGGGTWLPFTYTVPVPDAANLVRGMACQVGFSGGVPVGQTVALAQMQCEPGLVKTPFETVDASVLRCQCRHYYQRNDMVYTVTSSTSTGYFQMGFADSMRIPPGTGPVVYPVTYTASVGTVTHGGAISNGVYFTIAGTVPYNTAVACFASAEL